MIMPSQDREYEVKLNGREIDYLIDVLTGSTDGDPTKIGLGERIVDKLQNI